MALLLAMPFSNILNAKGSSSFSSSRSSSSSGFSSSRSSGSSGFSSSRSSGSSSSGGFSSNRSSGSSSTPKSSGFSSSSGSSTGKSWFGGSSSSSKNSFDHSAQRTKLTPFKPKEQYVSEFKAQNANKYPTTFTTPPAQRPAYIPQTTVVNNVHYPITYNQSAGGYGFVNALGTFMLYDAISDMAAHNYQRDAAAHVQAQQVTYNDYDGDSGWGLGSTLFLIFFLGLVAIVFVFWNS